MADSEKNPPIKKFKSGNVTSNVWQREHNGTAYYSVSFERSFKDANDEWKSSGSFDFGDLANLELTLGMAKRHMAALIQAENAD